MKTMFLRLWRHQEGQTLVEYVMVVALVSIAAMAMLTFLGNRINNNYYENFNNTLP